LKTKDYIEKLFYPKSIAIIGASSKRTWQIMGITERNYEGSLYLVSNEPEILGIKCYKELSQLPDEIDLAIIAITKKRVKNIIKQCIEKKFYNLHIFTAGLGEYDESGMELERQIFEMLENSNTRAIGPNCMGVYSTVGRIAYNPFFSKEQCDKNCVAFVSHSGDLTTRYVIKQNDYGVRFSNVASIGNSVSLKFTDFIEYFCGDEKTSIIAGYFEGFSKFRKFEGKKLLEVLKNGKKPILLLRGGVTERGKKAVNSHTGTIASNTHIWDSIFAQTNTIKVETYDELVDSTITFYYCQDLYPKNSNLLLITWSGGLAVLGTDRIIKLGLDLPEIQEPTKSKMQSMISIGSISNPLDLPWIVREEKYPEICKLAINEPYIGGVIFETLAPFEFDTRHEIYFNNIVKIINHTKKAKKPFIVALPYTNAVRRERLKNNFLKKGVPVIPSIERAAKAFLNLYKYKNRMP